MARRREFAAVSNDLLGTFSSRYNSINGYWALGFFQAILQGAAVSRIRFNLVPREEREVEAPFFETLVASRRALERIMASKKLPAQWLASAVIEVEAMADDKLACSVCLTSDTGRKFTSNGRVIARTHDPRTESRSSSRMND